MSRVFHMQDFGLKQARLVQAIKVMNEIEDLLVDIVKFQPQWRHLLQSMDMRVDKSLAVVRHQVLADHRALLASLGWPPKLLTSKHLQTRREDRQCNIFGQRDGYMRLWAIDEFVSPIASRIEYHFSKWSDQPEFMFALVYKITGDFIIGVDNVLQPLIDKARLVSYSAKEAWVSAMVQMLSGFLAKSIFPALVDRYKEKHTRSEVVRSWIDLIDHLVAFDKQIKSLVSTETGLLFEESERLDGLSRDLSALSIFCDKPDWLKIWAKIELKDGWKKLKLELKEERAWLIDKKSGIDAQTAMESEPFLLSTGEDYKAPLIAELAVKIAWDMIERCETLPAIQARIKFIRSSATRFFWYFFNVLVLRCKNTEFLIDYPDDALIKISGAINAARYVKSKLQEWSDDVKFLEMKICEENSTVDGNNGELNKSSFFTEEIKSLAELETNWIMDLISALLYDFETLSQSYWENLQQERSFEQVQEDQTSSRVLAAMDLAVSVDIVEALDTMKSKLHDLRVNLNPKDFLDLWRSVAEGLDHFISRTIFNFDIPFSAEDIRQFGADMKALFFVFQPFCFRPEAFFPCIRERLKLLNMSKQESDHFQVVISKNRNVKQCLRSSGFSHLSFDQVDKVLKNRKF